MVLSEDFVAEEFELGLFVVVNGDEDYSPVREEALGYVQTLRHKRQPLGVAVAVLAVNKRVVVDEIFVAGVVRGVYVDYVYLPFMGISERGKGVEIFALNQDMVR